ncbi:MAG TPA: YIP1 family protein [Methanoregula sp.]|nr:YIP1 family protein [Methanoregula sp.]
MNLSITDILFRPDAFFGTMMNEKESLKIPALIVLAGSIVAAAYGYLIGGLTAKMMASTVPGIETIITISTIGGALVGTFIFWILWAGIIYALSFAFKGLGSFSRMLQVVGYGYLPQILGSVITLIAATQYIPKITVPTLSSAAMQDPAMIEQTMKAFMHDPAMLELTQITSLITIVFLLWSANIWIFGAKHARQLSPRDSALCVGIPVVLYVLYLIYNIGVM